jgi:hypothetical protein
MIWMEDTIYISQATYLLGIELWSQRSCPSPMEELEFEPMKQGNSAPHTLKSHCLFNFNN